MNTCRICKDWKENDKGPLFKYGVRHYVHASCGFKKWGEAFLDKLSTWQIGALPYLIVKEFNMLSACKKRVA